MYDFYLFCLQVSPTPEPKDRFYFYNFTIKSDDVLKYYGPGESIIAEVSNWLSPPAIFITSIADDNFQLANYLI